MSNNQKQKWDLVIQPASKLFRLNFKELLKYKDLWRILVRRDIVTVYKQTVLGPVWFIIPPIITTLIFYLIFDRVAGISTDNTPGILFYMTGIVAWNYFADCITKTSNTFVFNSQLFGKVYFPRMIVPLSVVTSSMIKFSIQFLLFLCIFFYYYFNHESIHPGYYIFFIPLLVVLMAILGLGIGIIISSLTTKYRDLSFLVAFGVQLFMYATPVIYPLSTIPEKYKIFFVLNPMTFIIETFRLAFLGSGTFNTYHMIYTIVFSISIFLVGVILFNKVERTFMDTV